MLATLINLAGALEVTMKDLVEGIVWERPPGRPGRFVVEPIDGAEKRAGSDRGAR